MFDEIDQKLAEILMDNPRLPSDAIAKLLYVSASTVRRRIEKLVNEKMLVMTAYQDPLKIGLPVTATIVFNVKQTELRKVLEILFNYEEVRWLAVTSGRFDIVTICWFKSTEHLNNFLTKKIGTVPEISRAAPFPHVHTYNYKPVPRM